METGNLSHREIMGRLLPELSSEDLVWLRRQILGRQSFGQLQDADSIHPQELLAAAAFNLIDDFAE